MEDSFKEIQSQSLKDLFVRQIEGLIISGKLKIGERLPAERDIAANMKISRTIVNSGLIELAAKGLITIEPRKGTFVNDYRIDGTLTILDSLVNYNGELDEKLLDSMLQTRYLIEVENAGLAALNRTDEDLSLLRKIIKTEEKIDESNFQDVVNIDFQFHHQIAMATKNIVYPLIIKSFEGTYKNLTSKFFRSGDVISQVFEFHHSLYNSIEEKSADTSKNIMREILEHDNICVLLN